MPSWDNKPSGTMTAAVLTSPGSSPPSSCFTIKTDYPKPTLPSEDWVLVRVKAAGLNRAELRSRNEEVPGLGEFGIFGSEYRENPPPDILGEEFVGLVETAGANTSFSAGDAVTGFIYGGGKPHNGAYAEYTLCHSRRCFALPPTKLPWDVLGGIPMSMWTAWGSVFEAAQLRSGQTLLVHGATSSVGIWAVLLAKDAGARVIATTRQKGKVGKLRETGTDFVFLEEGLKEEVQRVAPDGVDAVLELVGPDAMTEVSLPLLGRNGTAVVTGVLTKQWDVKGFKPAMIPPTRKISFYGMTNRGSLGPEDEGLEKVPGVLADVVNKVESGKFSKDIWLDSVFSLNEVGKAHEHMEDNKAIGKVVITV